MSRTTKRRQSGFTQGQLQARFNGIDVEAAFSWGEELERRQGPPVEQCHGCPRCAPERFPSKRRRDAKPAQG